MGETAEIFGFSFVFRDALSSVYEISMVYMDKRAGPVAEISLERGEISLTGMEISPYYIYITLTSGLALLPGESSKIPPQAIFNNVKTTKLSRQAG